MSDMLFDRPKGGFSVQLTRDHGGAWSITVSGILTSDEEVAELINQLEPMREFFLK